MRIVGGAHKGRVLSEFKGMDIRPTADKVRESLFNILQFKIYGSKFLDLFCGTGAVGIEALSRGAREVVFNDKDKVSLKLVKRNLEKLDIKEGFTISNLDGVTFLNKGQKFDVIFIDPPYSSELGKNAIFNCEKVLEPNGIAILEDEKPFDLDIDGLTVVDRRKYGRAYLTFFKRTSEVQ